VVSLFDEATLGVAWVCVLIVAAAWSRGGKLRWTVIRLGLAFLIFGMVIGVIWSSTHSTPLDYGGALDSGADNPDGRHCYPVLLSWFVAGMVLLVRAGACPQEPVKEAPASVSGS
jgi:hypothetical protein